MAKRPNTSLRPTPVYKPDEYRQLHDIGGGRYGKDDLCQDEYHPPRKTRRSNRAIKARR